MTEDEKKTNRVSAKTDLKTYVIGFILSILLTMAAYILTAQHVHSDHEVFSHRFLTIAILSLAVIQLAVQMIFFLHLGDEPKPRWNLMVFGLMFSVLLIVVAGSLWIMDHLNYHMNPDQADHYVMQEEAIHK